MKIRAEYLDEANKWIKVAEEAYIDPAKGTEQVIAACDLAEACIRMSDRAPFEMPDGRLVGPDA